MGSIKIKNTFEGGINFDTTPEAVQNNQLRDAVNMDIYTRGKYTKLTQIDGDTYLTDYLAPVGANLNILGAYAVRAQYDYDGDLIFEQTNDSIIIYSYDDTNGSRITLVDLANAQSQVIYPNTRDNTSLDFPPLGTVSASFRQERSIPEIYWDDNRNPLRYLELRWSASPLWQPPSLRDLTARRIIGGLQPELVSVSDGGLLTCGTYQFAFRFYNSDRGTSSAWSLFCNPVAVALENNEEILAILEELQTATGLAAILLLAALSALLPTQLGGRIGQTSNKKIVLNIPFDGDEYQYYDQIQLAVVKNVDGQPIPSQIAYITEPSTEWYDNHTAVEYRGGDAEVTVDVAEIVTEDAAIKCAKTQVIKDNRLWRGNMTYNEFKNDRGRTTFTKAENYQESVYYKAGEETNWRKGYFHDEVYAYAIGYFDEFFNVGLVEPLDMGDMFWQNPTGLTFTVSSITPQYDVYYTLVVSSVTGLAVGDFIRLNGNIVQICEIGATTLLVKGDPGTTIGVLAAKLYGQQGNQTNGWAWKFPKREANQYTILNERSQPQALGLKITGISNYPTWAKGAVILRQKRKKNILYQFPHIPTIGVMGVPTQGVGPITYNEDDPFNLVKINLSKADYKGQYDTICPKVLGFGTAKNIAKWARRWTYNEDERKEKYYIAYWPYYINQQYEYSNIQPVDLNNSSQSALYAQNLNYGAEIPGYIYALPPEYVFNNSGEPTITNAITGGEYVQAVDAIALRRQILREVEAGLITANTYTANDGNHYLYGRTGLVYEKIMGQKQYFVSPQDIDTQFNKVDINRAINTVLGSAEFLLTDKPFESELYANIELYGAQEKLSAQQGEAAAIPSSPPVRSFFNTIPNQRAMVLNLNGKIQDISYIMRELNIFPNLIKPQTITDLVYLEQLIGDINDDRLLGDRILPTKLPTANIFAGGDNEVAGGAWVLNVYKGLPDDRYSKISTDWVSTGTVHYFTADDQENNTPFDVEIWGGDCFVTKYAVKVNNDTPRISDRYNNINAEADDYKTNKDNNWFNFSDNVKTGSYQNNVEFMQLYIESEINTEYYQEISEYPAYFGANISNYAKPYLFAYNGSYSVNNDLKTFVTKAEDIKDTNGRYPARFVWSDESLYQADSSALVETNGFIRYRVLNRKDLDEKFGGINGFADFGDANLYSVMDYKVRLDPINRGILTQADTNTLVVAGTKVVGDGGYYLPIDNGSQHMRTIKTYSGACFFVDAQKKQVITFGSKTGVISQDLANAYFDRILDKSPQIREIDLAGYIDYTNDKQEYVIIKFPHADIPADGIAYNTKTGIWKSRLDTGDDKMYAILVSGEYLWRLSNTSVFKAYSGDKGNLLGAYRKSKFGLILNDYAGFSKRFNVVNFEGQGAFRLNIDEIYATAPQYNPQYPAQVSGNLLAYTPSIQPPPYQYRNYQYWLNRIRNLSDNAPMRGDYLILDFVINNDADVGAIELFSTSTDCEQAYRNR